MLRSLLDSRFARVLWFWHRSFVRPFLSQDWLIRFFWNFVWSWGLVSTEKWQSRIFWKNSRCPENGPKRPKIARFDIFLYFSQDCFIRFFWYFAWSWGLISTSKWHSGLVWENSRLPKNWAKHTRNWPVFYTCIIFSRLVCYILLIFCKKLRVYKVNHNDKAG